MSALSKLSFSVENQPKLKERFENICHEAPYLRIRMFVAHGKQNKAGEIRVTVMYLWDATAYPQRECKETGGLYWLARFTLEEIAFIHEKIVALAADEFNVELGEVSQGVFNYHFTPKPLPAT